MDRLEWRNLPQRPATRIANDTEVLLNSLFYRMIPVNDKQRCSLSRIVTGPQTAETFTMIPLGRGICIKSMTPQIQRSQAAHQAEIANSSSVWIGVWQ